MEVKPGYKQTEVGVIPEEWEVKPLGSIAELKNGYAFKSETYTSLGELKVVTIANVQDGYMDTAECNRISVIPRDAQAHHRLNLHDILISMTGNVGRVCRVSERDCLLNQRVGKLVPTGVDNGLLFLLLSQRKFLAAMALKAKGGAQGNLSVSDITEFQFPVPTNEAEQRAIATALSDVDGLLGALDRLIAKKRDLKQAAMQQLLTGQTRLPGFHGEWEVKALHAVCQKVQDGTHFSPKLGGNDFLYVTSKNIRFGMLDMSTAERISAAEHFKIYARCDVKKGDLLLTKDGANTGNAALNPMDEPFSLLSSVAMLRFDSRHHSPAYFMYQILSNFGQMQIKDAMSGNAITRLTLQKIRALRFSVAPLPEQTAIAEVLTELDAELAALEQRREKTRALKQAMMQELLTGRTRLPVAEVAG